MTDPDARIAAAVRDGVVREGAIGRLAPLAASVTIHAVLVLTLVAGVQSLGPHQTPARIAWMTLEAPPPTVAPIDSHQLVESRAPTPSRPVAAHAEPRRRDVAPRTPRRETIRQEPIASLSAAAPSSPPPADSALPRRVPEPTPQVVASASQAPGGFQAPSERQTLPEPRALAEPRVSMAGSESADPAPATLRPAVRGDARSQDVSRPSASTDRGTLHGTTTASLPSPGFPSGVPTRPAQVRGGYQVRPPYPAAARERGIQGVTLLRVHVETDGRVDDVAVHESAGHRELDRAAADAVRQWRFEPARNDAGPVAMWVLIPVEFRLIDGH